MDSDNGATGNIPLLLLRALVPSISQADAAISIVVSALSINSFSSRAASRAKSLHIRSRINSTFSFVGESLLLEAPPTGGAGATGMTRDHGIERLLSQDDISIDC